MTRLKTKNSLRIMVLAYCLASSIVTVTEGCGTSSTPEPDGTARKVEKSQTIPQDGPSSAAQGSQARSSTFFGSKLPSSPSTATQTSVNKQPVAPVPTNTPVVGYANTIKPLLDQRCVSCHSTTNARGGIELDSKAQAVRFYQASLRAVQIGTMPRGNPLSAAQKQVFQAWGQAKFPD